ncbi:phage tail tape measure protein [Phocoenobacter skyensis]|uniref:phage tail tape measure protein n=1 Tax=Phocoenobacter skyensis TaxID=97481 RepID=UPI0027633C8F|nr:phage tail tape measure protein [Pasteurella skyensis]MDP8184413.1 phage tail tape measure protein [Pasteurella skyensis]
MADIATLAVQITSTGAVKAKNDLKGFEAQAKKTEKQTDSLSNSLRALKLLFAAGILGQSIKSVIRMSDKMQSLNAQVKFVTKSTQEYLRVQEKLFSIAQGTRSSLEATTTLYTRSARALKDYGYSQNQLLNFTETLNKAMIVGGATAQEQASALLQLSQALGSGRLQGDEFRSISESAPIILDVVAEYMGKSRGEIKKLASEGKITSQILFNAIGGASKEISQQFDTMPLTFGQAMQQMENSALKFVDKLLNQTTGVVTSLASGVSFLANNFNMLASVIGSVLLVKMSSFAKAQLKSKINTENSIFLTEKHALAIKQRALATKGETVLLRAKATAELSVARSDMVHLQAQLRLAQNEQQRMLVRTRMAEQSRRISALHQVERVAITNLAVATNALSQANGRLSLSQRIVAGTSRLLKGALGLLGGPLGIITIAISSAIGIFYDYKQSLEEARQKALEFADTLPDVTKNIEKLTALEIKVNLGKAEESIEEQRKKIAELTKEYEHLKQISSSKTITYYDPFTGLTTNVDKSADVIKKQLFATAKAELELDKATKKLNNTLAEQKKLLKEQSFVEISEQLNILFPDLKMTKEEFNALGISVEQFKNLLPSAGDNVSSFNNTLSKTVLTAVMLTNAMNGLSQATAQSIDPKIQEKLNALKLSLEIKKARNSGNTYKANRLTARQRAMSALGGNFDDKSEEYKQLFNSYLLIEQENNRKRTLSTLNSQKEKHEKMLGQWKDYYSQLESSSADSLTRIALEQKKELDKLAGFIKSGVVPFEEAERSKTIIAEKYAKERQAIAEKYAPEIKVKREYDENVAEIQALQQSGDLTQKQANNALQEQEYNKWLGLADRSDPMNGWKKSMHDFGVTANDVMGNVANIGMNAFDGMSDELTKLVMTGKADFGALAKSILTDLTKMIIKMMLFNAIKSAFGGFSGGGAVSTPQQAYSGGLIGYATGGSVGGFTGQGGKYTPAGIVHKGEYVLTKEATSRLGINYLDYLNYQTRSRPQGFATGGGVSVPTVHGRGISRSDGVKVNIINNGEQATANVSTKEDKDGNLEITVELMKKMQGIARIEANSVIQNNFRSGGMFA